MAGRPGIKRISDEIVPSHQERINIEMFRAIEMLGRKLERAENARDHISRRLVQIESSATLDEKTGKLYLPVVSGHDAPVERAPKWQSYSSVMSSVLALCAIGLVLFREPVPQQQLTAGQLAALDQLTRTQFARMDTGRWKPLNEETARDLAVNSIDVRRFTATDEPQPPPAYAVPEENFSSSEETQVAEAELPVPPAPPEVAQIEPAAGETSAEVWSPVEKPAVKTAEAKKPAPKKPLVKKSLEELASAEKPLPKPASNSAPIPLTQTSSERPFAVTIAAPAEKPAEKTVVAEKEAEKPAASARPAVFGVSPDTALPGKLAALEKRAFEGVPEAQHDLATIYASGKLVAQDYKRAVFWFSQAADRGVANAHYNLGVMFQQGLGVRQDVNKALGWYEKAASLGHPEAMYNLGIAYIEGIGTPRNINRGVTFFKQAANAGVAQAAYNLGVLYESNFIGPIDLAKANEWYQVASNEGHQEAKQAIARLKAGIAATDTATADTDSYNGEDIAAKATSGNAADRAMRDSGLDLAKNVEPAAGEEGYGEGDESPIDEQGRATAPGFGDDLVRKIQEALITRGELPPSTTTGYMTPQTEDAIRAWQKSLGWEVDGRPSRELLEKITVAGGKK